MRAINFTTKQNDAIISLESLLETNAIKDGSQAMFHVSSFNDRIAKILSKAGLLWSLAVSEASANTMVLLIFK